MFQAIFLDLDGTMIDTRLDFLAATHLMLRDFDLRASCIDEAFVTGLIGKGADHLIRRVFERVLGLPVDAPGLEVQLEAARSSWALHHHVVNGRQSWVFPGVRVGLESLRDAGVPMVCVTNKAHGLAHELLSKFQLRQFFSGVVGGDMVRARKPAPDLLLKAAGMLAGVNIHHCLMVGDSSNDRLAADASRCPCVLVTYGYNHGHSIVDEPALAHVDTLAGIDWLALYERALLKARTCPA